MVDDEAADRTDAFRAERGAVAVAGQDKEFGVVECSLTAASSQGRHDRVGSGGKNTDRWSPASNRTT